MTLRVRADVAGSISPRPSADGPASTAAVILAAGEGRGFRSRQAHVLYNVAGRSMLRWVLEAVRPLNLDRVVVVVGYQADEVRAEAQATGIDGVEAVVQSEQRGTEHALRTVLDVGALEGIDTVVVLPGDVPLLHTEVLEDLLSAHKGHAATLLTTRTSDAGRLICALDVEALAEQLKRPREESSQKEVFLMDVIAGLVERGVSAVAAPPELLAGVNDHMQLAEAGVVLRKRILEQLMENGVRVVDPATTYVDADAVVGPDTVLLPGTHVLGHCQIGRSAVIGPYSQLVDAVVGDGASVTFSVVLEAAVGSEATVGPFAYLQPGTRLERRAKAGTFVEMKNTAVGEASTVAHLSYMGNATIGRGVNVGAGTITCNYDGRTKHPTIIDDEAFIGSDTMLVAPVMVGRGAVTGAGSTITKDVPPGALAVERSEQRNFEGYDERRKPPT